MHRQIAHLVRVYGLPPEVFADMDPLIFNALVRKD